MRNWGCVLFAALLLGVFQTLTVEAAEFRRLDGIHRVEKEAHITGPAVLGRRDEDLCGTTKQLCPSSLGGGCCPSEYRCATDSCYATTKGPSVCGSRTGWFACDPSDGPGCCPEGYLCKRGDLCVPPSGVAYSYDCPTGQYLCPASMSYGCCPNGMGCAVNQCYATSSTMILNTLVFTTTDDGTLRTYASTSTTVEAPVIPTNVIDSNAGADQQVLKYFPPTFQKEFPTTVPSSGDGGGGISTGVIAGIAAGSVAFLVIVVAIAYVTIRHLNKVVAAVSVSKQSTSSRSRPQQQEPKPNVTDSEFDAMSVDPLMISPRPSHPRPDGRNFSPLGPGTPDFSSNDQSGVMGGYQNASGSERNSRQTSFDAEEFLNTAPNTAARLSQQSAFTQPSSTRYSRDSHGRYSHLRQWSDASDGSDGNPPAAAWAQVQPSELEATPYIPELPTPASPQGPPLTERRVIGGSTNTTSRPPVSHQRKRSEGRSRSGSSSQLPLAAVDEEMHGFHGPSNHFVGQTSHRPVTRREASSNNNNQEQGGIDGQNQHSFQ